MSKWIFLKKQADRSASGDAFRNNFEGKDMVKTLARESIQNAVDEIDGQETLRVRFIKSHSVDLTAVFTDDYSQHARASNVELPADLTNCAALYVEDYGTKGLTGRMSDFDSNMYRLMGQLGGSAKRDG